MGDIFYLNKSAKIALALCVISPIISIFPASFIESMVDISGIRLAIFGLFLLASAFFSVRGLFENRGNTKQMSLVGKLICILVAIVSIGILALGVMLAIAISNDGPW